MTSSKKAETVVTPDPAGSAPIEDPVPAEVRAVIELFASQLANVSFPDVDASALRRQADELRVQAKEVARVRESLDAALASFVTRLATLTETSARAVAYARIYSVAHPDQQALAAAIAALAQPAEAAAGGSPSVIRRRNRAPRRRDDPYEAGGSRQHHDDAV